MRGDIRKLAGSSKNGQGLLALVGLCCGFVLTLASFAAPAAADDNRPDRILIEYVPPKNPEHQKIYETLKAHHALEKLQEIFSPFKLPIDVTIKTVGCDGVDNAWYQRPTLTICYEYLDSILKTAPQETSPAGITRQDAMIGQFFYVVGHEMGHCMFDLLNVPLFGRPEDAADEFSTYLMLKLGKDQARRLIGGAAYTYKEYVDIKKVAVPQTAFADVHGAPMQRLYNMLCIAYGADPAEFGDLVDKGYLPAQRAKGCHNEYGELNFAFQQLIVPHLDKDLTKKVLDETWLPPAKNPPPPPDASAQLPAAAQSN
jgi:Putative metallopeptidase